MKKDRDKEESKERVDIGILIEREERRE